MSFLNPVDTASSLFHFSDVSAMSPKAKKAADELSEKIAAAVNTAAFDIAPIESDKKTAAVATFKASVIPLKPFASLDEFTKEMDAVPFTVKLNPKELYEQVMAKVAEMEKLAVAPYHVLSKKNVLLRSIYRTEDGIVFILFNKSKEDIVIANACKKVKLALEIHTLKWCASTSMSVKLAGLEDEGRKLVQNIPRILLPDYKFQYISKKRTEKRREISMLGYCLIKIIALKRLNRK